MVASILASSQFKQHQITVIYYYRWAQRQLCPQAAAAVSALFCTHRWTRVHKCLHGPSEQQRAQTAAHLRPHLEANRSHIHTQKTSVGR